LIDQEKVEIVSLLPPQILYPVHCNKAEASAVRNRQNIALAMAQP